MNQWHIRDFHADDLDGILRLWEEIAASGTDPVYALSEVLASCQKDDAVVAVHGDEVVGAAASRAGREQPTIWRASAAPAPRCLPWWPPSSSRTSSGWPGSE